MSRTFNKRLLIKSGLVMTLLFLSPKPPRWGHHLGARKPTSGRWECAPEKASGPKRQNVKRKKIHFCCHSSFYSLSLISSKLLFPTHPTLRTSEYYQSSTPFLACLNNGFQGGELFIFLPKGVKKLVLIIFSKEIVILIFSKLVDRCPH